MNSARAASWAAQYRDKKPLRRPYAQGVIRFLVLLIAQSWVSISPLYAPETGPVAPAPMLTLELPANLPPSRFPFRSYGVDSGIDNLAVRRITQDRAGFLWVGTEDGLYRYDGDRFARFDFSDGLPSTWITDLLATPEGDLWVCTPRGLAARNGDHFNTFRAEIDGVPAGACNALARDSRGINFVAYEDGLFFQQNNRFRRVEGLPAGPVTAIVSLPAPSTSIFVGVKGIVFRIDGARVVDTLPIARGSFEPIDSLAADGSGRIWAQSARKLFCLIPEAREFREDRSVIPAVSSRGVLSTDRGGHLWVPTDEGMSCKIGGKWLHFGSEVGLPIDWTRCIFEDREGSLWIGSLGVHRLIGRGSWILWNRASGLPSDTIWDIYRSRRGDLWVATNKGLCLATRKGWRVARGTEKTVVRRIHEDSEGWLWLGLVPAAVLRYDPKTQKIIRFGPSKGIAGLRVLCLEQDSDGQLYAATDRAGLLRYRPKQGDFIRENVPGGTPEETFRFILCDKYGRLWATGEHGLLLKRRGVWRRFNRQDGLLRDHVSYITELPSGELWLSYFEPLRIDRLKINGDRLQILEHLDRTKGLSSEKVYLLAEDLKKNLWVGTEKGIDVLLPEGVLHFSKEDGLAGDDTDAMAILVESDGSLFIGTSLGLSYYRSNVDHAQIQAPRPVFLSASLGDKKLATGASSISTFPHQFNTLKIEFAVLSYLHESQIEHEMRLRGLESEWHRSRFREARYPGLAPGYYVFEVRSRLGSGPWSAPAILAFEIRPPWWRTWPAIIAWLILAASSIYWGVRWQLRRLRERTRQLENLVAARTAELAAANADLERLSITDPLTGLKNRRFLEFSIAEDLARIRRTHRSEQDGSHRGFSKEIAGVTFLLVDLDHFKQVNDRFGHSGGDHVLRQIGGILCAAVRESDTVVRWGGEEFLIVARSSKEDDPVVLAERIRNQVEAALFSTGDEQNLRVTCTVGFSSWPFFPSEPDAISWEEVVGLADRCLYSGKNNGRNAWVGVRISPDYRGKADPAALDDFRAATAAGIIEIKSSTLKEAAPKIMIGAL